jgi:hypothetical protein
MKQLVKRLRRDRETTTPVRQTVHTVAIGRHDYELLKCRGFTEPLAQRYYQGLRLGAIVRIEPHFNQDHTEFRLARLLVHPMNPLKRSFVRSKTKPVSQ